MRHHADPGAVHLDAASSEPLHPAAREVLLSSLDLGYADPRRLHRPGRSARMMLDNARQVVAGCLGVRPDEVTFTPSGTHAVHLGLLGLAAGRVRYGSHLAVSAVEHSSVMHAGQWHAERGGSFDTVRVDASGRVDLEALRRALDAPDPELRPAAVAVQAANHEVGTVQPIAEVAELARAADEVPVFMDACASMGRLPLPEGWAVAAGSAHKWGGPAGVGVLLVRKGARWRPPFPVDDRADPRATGFENVPGALAAAAALQAVSETDHSGHHALVERIRSRVAEVPDVEVVGDPTDRLPHLVTFSFLYVDGEALVSELDRRGLGVASGSACTASTLTPSHVLAAMGVLTHGNVRVSLPASVSADELSPHVDRLLQALPDVVSSLRKEAGL